MSDESPASSAPGDDATEAPDAGLGPRPNEASSAAPREASTAPHGEGSSAPAVGAESAAPPAPDEPTSAAPPAPDETTLEGVELLVLRDPGDDAMRAKYLKLADADGKHLRAANVLARAAGANEAGIRERIWCDAGTLYWQEAELPRARSAFLQAVLAGAGGPAGLLAARRVLDLEVDPGDPDALGPALDLIVRSAPEAADREDAAGRLLALHARAEQDASRLAMALGALADSPRAAEATEFFNALHPLDPARALDIAHQVLEPDATSPFAKSASSPALMRAMIVFQRDRLGDVADVRRAATGWRRLLDAEPTNLEAIEALLEASAKLADASDLLEAVARACPSLSGSERRDVTLRTARALAKHGVKGAAVTLCRGLLDEPNVDATTAQAIAEIAHDEDETELYRAALEAQVRTGGDDTKKRALERLGDLQITRFRDSRAAAESWRPAARMYEERPSERAHAQGLYERVLDALPDDRDAAQRLTQLYRQSNEWVKLPDVLRVLIRTEIGEEGSARLLLDLEKGALEAGAIDEYVSLLDDVLARSDAKSAERVRPLKRARARALASDASRHAQTSLVYRELIEAFADSEDVRDYETFVESLAGAHERHQDRRWLYAWRAGREPHPAKLLLEWARAEDEIGETDAALAVYQRLADTEPGRKEALEALCRLKLHAGDFEGGLAALRSLREAGGETERRAVILRMARLLVEEMGRPAEAAVALLPLIGVVPPVAAANKLLQSTLADPATRAQVVERLEELAVTADLVTRLNVYKFLASARAETASMPDGRLRWIRDIVELTGDRAVALTAAIDGVLEFPDAMSLWDAAEEIARPLGQGEALSQAYHRVLVEGEALEPVVAETLGRRMVALEAACGIESPRLVEALQRMLDVVPGARWGIDRVKLVLGSQARWDELFRLYDRAIAATDDAAARASLLDEAAFAAKDLAGLPDRAIVYLESIHDLRPEDPAVDAALERLYERQGRTSALIELLDERLSRSTGFQHRELLGKMAALWLDLGSAEQAIAIVERVLSDSAPVADVVALLERVAAAARTPVVAAPPGEPAAAEHDSLVAAQKRAIVLLRGYYESTGRADDLVRMAVRELALAVEPEQRAQGVRELVRLRLLAAEGTATEGIFVQVIPRVEADVSGDALLAKIAFEALLQRALQAWKQPASPARDDAAEGAWRAIHLLKTLLVETSKAEAALNLLYRCSRLPFERRRGRELLREAALVCAGPLADPVRAIRTFGELFEEEGGDEVAAASLPTFAALLESSGELQRLATLWEAQSRVHAANAVKGAEMANATDAANAKREATAQRACLERAARLWEQQGAAEKAIAAYEEAGALGSASAFEALARIHSDRGAWVDAARALEWLVAHATPAMRGLRALQLADACVALGDRSRARSCLESALAAGVEAERVEQVPERLIGLYRDDEAWQPLARLLSAQARRPTHPERRLAWLRESAELHWRKLDEPAEAASLLELAVSWYPLDAALRPALADVLEALEQWDRTALVLRDQVALHKDQRSKERALTHHRLARALTRAGKGADALAELRIAAEMHPGHPAILYDLGHAALAAGQLELAEGTYRTLLLALHHAMEGAAGETGPSGPHRAEVFVELAEVAVQRGDAARALDLVDSAVDAALEAGDDPKRFEAPLAARGRYDALARAVERRVERAATLAARASALSDLAVLWAERLERAEETGTRIARHAERMGRELEHEGLTDAAAWTALASAHRAFGDDAARLSTLQRRAALLEAAIPNLEAGQERGRLRLELAKARLEDPARADSAVALLSGALDDAPEQSEAAELLATALERLERFDELVVVLERQLEAAPVAASVGATRWRLAKALDRAGRTKEALPVYESIVDDGPSDPDRLNELIDRLAALGSERLADALERKLAAGSESAPVLARRLLDLRDRAGDAAGALRALEFGFAAEPGNASFFRRLVDAYRKLGDEGRTLRLLDPAIAARPEDTELLLLRSEARESLADDDGALFDLETAAVAEDRHVDALLALHDRVVIRQGRLPPQSDGRLPATADAFAIRVIDVLLHAKRLESAKRELDRLLERTPAHVEGLERRAAIHGADGEWALALETYRRLLPLAERGDRELLVRVATSMADVCERSGDAGAARDALESALVVAPESQELMQRLERVCEATGDVTRLAHLLASHAERHDAAPERTRLFVRAGNLLLDGAQDPAGALAVAERARAADADSVEAVLLWATAQRRLGRAHEAIAALDETTSRARGKRTPLLARAHLETAKAHLAVDEIAEAFDSLKAGFNMDWRNAEIAMILGLVAIDLDDDKLAERALSGLSATPAPRRSDAGEASSVEADAALQAGAFYRLALLAQAKGDRGKSKRMATRALAADAGCAPARALLDQLEPGGTSPANRSGPRPAVTPRS